MIKNTTKDNNIKVNGTTQRQKCEVWTRVMGYYRPVENFNEGKKEEYRERQTYKISVERKQAK